MSGLATANVMGKSELRICVIGAGYVGLVSAAGLASLGHRVVCCDSDRHRLAQLNDGQLPLFEPGLDALVAEGQNSGRLVFSQDCTTAVAQSEIVFIAVGTPMDLQGKADLSQVLAAADMICDAARTKLLVLIKSTVAIGTGEALARRVAAKKGAGMIEIVSNPEFLREGSAVEDFLHPERIVFGVKGGRKHEKLKALYAALPGRPTILFTSQASAEMIKYASNSFLAIKVSFINEMADFCEQLGADVGDVAKGMGLDTRIGEQFLKAGPGFGGSCFPKDMEALLESAASVGLTSKLIAASIRVNSERIERMVSRVRDFCGGRLEGKTIGVLGLTFKPDTDDIRASPAMGICLGLLAAGGQLQIYDPKGMAKAKPELPKALFFKNAYACTKGADIAVLVTEWAEFARLDLNRLGAGMAHKRLLDLRNLFSPQQAREAGFEYRSVGRADQKAIS